MATTTKKKTETIEKKNLNVEIVDKEKELLKEKLANQDKELQDLKAQLDLLLRTLSQKEDTSKKEVKNKKTIKFINMTTGGFTIHGTRFYHLDKQFDYLIFPENEARTIVNNMPNSVANGQLYIADHDFVEECELDYIYETLIDDKTLKDLLKKNPEDVCEIYRNASDMQKKIIVDMVVEKQINREKVDANLLVSLGELCGVNFINIEPLEKEE